jgi:DNA-binding NarL/FixJ family response regulator
MRNLLQLAGLKVVILSTKVQSIESLVRQFTHLSPDIDIKIINSARLEFVELTSGSANILMLDLYEMKKIPINLLLRYKKSYPAMKLIALCDGSEVSVIEKLFSAGIHICMTKSIQAYEIGIVLEKAMNGENYVSTEIGGRLAHHLLLKKK